MDFLKDTWYLYLRLVRVTRRMPVFLLLSIMQPVLWMLLFGQLFGAVIRLEGFGAESYLQFITPGISIMTALFSAAYTGIGLLRDIEAGVLDRLLATPVSRAAVVASRVLLAASQVTVQAAIILAIGLALGAEPYGGIVGLLCVLFAASLLSAAFASTSCGLALIIRRQELVIAAMNFIILPSTFLSSMIMTHALMPPWIRAATRFNPVDWAVTAARHGFQGQLDADLAVSLGLLAALTLVCGAFASRAFDRYQRVM
jgi:ABC-2 type transport system permease protein